MSTYFDGQRVDLEAFRLSHFPKPKVDLLSDRRPIPPPMTNMDFNQAFRQPVVPLVRPPIQIGRPLMSADLAPFRNAVDARMSASRGF